MGAPRFVMEDFWPSDLFLGGIPGAWYDPTDLSTMFQDSAGTTPVTAVEQPVGLILDKSQGLALGAELVTNGNFSSGTTGWTAIAGATLSIDAGRLKVAQGLTDFVSASQGISTIAGRTYKVTFDLISDGTSSPSFVVYARQFAGSTNIAFSSSGFGNGKSFYFTAVGATTYIEPGSATSADNIYGLFDNVSVVEIAGNHASQSTAASRPTYRARYNLLTFSEQMDNGAWTKSSAGTGSAPVVTPNAAVAPDGTLTADSVLFNRGAGNAIGDQSLLSQAPTVVSGTYTQSVWLKAAAPADVGKQLAMRNVAGSSYLVVTLTADWVRYTRTETGSLSVWDLANRGTITTGNSVTALVWGAQLLTAADVTATGNAYQRIAASTVYDTAPIFRPYLAFDGLDDSLSTANVNFSTTNKVTVWTGVTKLADAGQACIVELTAASGGGAAFAIFGSSPAGPNYQVRSIGTIDQNAMLTTYAAPITNVITLQGDIGAPLLGARINAIDVLTRTLSQGTGNYSNAPLFIGRRNNATLPLNGRLYEMIVRGAASSVTEIADTELWVNARTGAY